MLIPQLAFPAGALPPPGSHLLLSSTFTARADVALFHLVIAATTSSTPIIWLDLRSETVASWDAVLRKLGTPLPKGELFTHIAPSPLGGDIPLFDGEPTLQPTFAAVTAAIPTTPFLLILDGLSDLVDIGFEPVQVSRFVRALLARCRTGSVVSTLHADTIEDNELLDRLCRLSSWWWRIEGLSTGRSSEVSGEISTVSLGSANHPGIPKDKALQYRLEPSAVKVFAKGTGRGYL